MADTLEDYLAADFLSEKQDIEDINRTLEKVSATFLSTFSGKGWPYEFKIDPTKPISQLKEVSQGTLAMVLIAIGRMENYCKLPIEAMKATFEGEQPLFKVWLCGLGILADEVHRRSIGSGTFGDHNPITLSHVSELFELLSEGGYSAPQALLKKGIDAAIAPLEELLKAQPATCPLLSLPEDSIRNYCTNAFVPLRALRAAKKLNLKIDPLGNYRRFFESNLHDHLSFSSIPDSRFDPAELVFCLEGLLLCAPEAVDSSLFSRVLQVLAEKQNTSAHWRPTKPFLASSRGDIILPVSVEVANSLMRSTETIDRDRRYETFTSKTLPLVQRFWHWLRARSLRFDHKGKPCVGWHSEHVNEANLIHIWDTSQVMEFMLAFKAMMDRHIATKTLRLSGLDVKRPKPKSGDASTAVGRWKDKVRDFEPMLDAPNENRVYERILADFVTGWAAGKPRKFSMLLFGPPGTGKSSLAENLAEVLEAPLVTVTVSDFLGGGGANVEARAKAIFQTLEAQNRSVILFDEIDSFLLDRDTKRYDGQDSLFQFLTPGMLTKFNDLRKRKRSIFIIATNFANRIDPAIKRAGRIDEQYLLPLPNAARRIRILEELKVPIPDDATALKSKTAFFGYSDLKGAVEAVDGKPTAEAVVELLDKRSPATSFDSYLKNFRKDEKFPEDEFIGLMKLAVEIGKQGELHRLLEENPKYRKKLKDSPKVIKELNALFPPTEAA